MNPSGNRLSRRLFLIRSAQAGAGLTVATMLPLHARSAEFDSSAARIARGEGVQFNAFIAITPDNRVIVTIKHLEMGQGTYTGLATIAAEELDAAWDQVEAVGAPADLEKFKRHDALGIQLTAGSASIQTSWTQMREAGAAVRHMLIEAAARKWQVPRHEISTSEGIVRHVDSARHASYGGLAESASELFAPKDENITETNSFEAFVSLPDKLQLKDPANFKLVGRESLPRKDTGKTDGSAIYTMDVQMPGLLTAVVARPPMFGGRVKAFDATRAESLPGVQAVLDVPSGIAVLANSYWEAHKARQALEIDWEAGEDSDFSSEDLYKEYHDLASKPGVPAFEAGDVDAALSNSEITIEANYEFPYLAHSALEPVNCVLQRTADGVEMWFGCQSHTWDQNNVAEIFGIEPQQVTIHTLYAGGSFGRRATFDADVPVELAHIAKGYKKSVPIKLVYTREDDTHKGYYRPLVVHKLTAALGAGGRITALRDRVVSQSITGAVPGMTDPSTVDDIPYAIPNRRVESHNTYLPVPPLFYRSVGATHNAFALETFVDEVAQKAGRDSVEFRLGLLKDRPRHRRALDMAADKANWGGKLHDGRFQGIAVYETFHTVVANVAEIAHQPNGKFKLLRVICVVDCGLAVNPDVVRQQMTGGIGYGLSPVLFNEITIRNGQPQQSNFHDCRVLRIEQMPDIDVHIVRSTESPSGVGEPGVPVIGPALANALAAATGKRFYRLPLGNEHLEF